MHSCMLCIGSSPGFPASLFVVACKESLRDEVMCDMSPHIHCLEDSALSLNRFAYTQVFVCDFISQALSRNEQAGSLGTRLCFVDQYTPFMYTNVVQ